MKNLVKLYRTFSSIQKATDNTKLAKREYLQFSKKKLVDFGELPQGQIPDALQYDHQFNLSNLKNGIKVGSENTGGPLASLQILVNAGTRQETLETSGTSQFIKKLVLRGTASKNKEQVEKELDSLGGQFNVNVTREFTTFNLSFEPGKLDQAVSFLGDIILNSSFNKTQVEAEKEGIVRKCLENVKDQQSVVLESIHYTSYRDHFISQPTHGIRENIPNITADQIKTYHQSNYVGDNIIIAGSGNISHNALLSASEKSFGAAASHSAAPRINTEKPYFTPSSMYMRDDEMHNANIGVFFEAPSYNDPDYFAMVLFRNMLGEYRADKFTGKHLNSTSRQYSLIHEELGNLPDVTIHQAVYFPYSDTGLFGNYLHGNEVFANQMLYLSQWILTEYSSYINPVEIFRARNKLYNHLLNDQDSAGNAAHIAKQLAYWGRRVPRSEFSKRISHYDAGLLNRVATRWFWDKELSIVAWGPIHGLMASSHQNRPIRRSTLGWYGNMQYRVM